MPISIDSTLELWWVYLKTKRSVHNIMQVDNCFVYLRKVSFASVKV